MFQQIASPLTRNWLSIAVAILYLVASAFPFARAAPTGRGGRSRRAAACLGFGSFLADQLRIPRRLARSATLVLLPTFVGGLDMPSRAAVASAGWLREERGAPDDVRAGRWLLLATGAGIAPRRHGDPVSRSTEVFVREDLGSWASRARCSTRRIPPGSVDRADRAGFGGGLATRRSTPADLRVVRASEPQFIHAVIAAGVRRFWMCHRHALRGGYMHPFVAPAFAGAGLFVLSVISRARRS